MRVAGMLQTALSRSNSLHVAMRSSPGLGNSSAISFNAARVPGWPSKESMARSNAPNAFGSVIAARGVTFGRISASRSAMVGSFCARAVAIAYRNTVPIVDRSLRALS